MLHEMSNGIEKTSKRKQVHLGYRIQDIEYFISITADIESQVTEWIILKCLCNLCRKVTKG